MALPLKYNLRNVVVRWKTTGSTVLGVALVVAVYVLLEALAQGIEKNSANTGDPRNVLVVRKGSQAESSSLVTREQVRTLQYAEEIARDAKGEPLITADIMTLVSAMRIDLSGEANLILRGISARGAELRPQVALVQGRMFAPGKREVIVAKSLAGRFKNLDIGGALKAGPDHLTVVGIFTGGGSAFDSEAWMDVEEARALFDRDMYSSLLIRAKDEASLAALTNRIGSDKRLALLAQREVDYYKSQTGTAVPIKILANLLGTAMSIGAIFAAMNTMYASVGARTREIGTLRVLGYSRRTVVACFLVEGSIIALFGGLLGCGVAMMIHTYVIASGIMFGTMNFESFSETVFQFAVTPALMVKGLVFSVFVGLIGSLLPALRASRLPVISALKSL
ncbi:MAG TPA: ABC transporter permease [Candidatus Limnocylindria bacterium]|jgi:putative ABC transport system permease protein|nr:ABC transporter permease [Candidatus Limnocylindria bacterium]